MLYRQLRLIQHTTAFWSFKFRKSGVQTLLKSQHALPMRFLQTASIAEQVTPQPQQTGLLGPLSYQTVAVGDGNSKDTRLVQSEACSPGDHTVSEEDGSLLRALISRTKKSLRLPNLFTPKSTGRPTRTARPIAPSLRRRQARLSSYRQQTLRTKYVSLGYNLAGKGRDSSTSISSYTDAFSTKWTTAFASASAPYDGKLRTDREFRDHSGRTRIAHAVQGRIIRSWSEVPKHRKRLMWRRLMIKALHLSPVDALMIIDDTLEKGQFKPPRYCMEDSLDLITCRLLQHEDVQGHMIKSLHSSISNYISTYNNISGTASISQRTIFLLSKFCSVAQLISLCASLREHNVSVHLNTKLQLITRFLDYGMVEAALNMLHSLDKTELHLDQVQSVCVRLLRLYLDVDNIYAVRSSMLARMLMLGLRPNMHLYNVILLNAMEAGDQQMGWRIYRIARDHGLKPDAYTYAILLKGLGEKGSLEAIWRDAYNDGVDIKKNPRLATEYFYAVYLAEQNGPQNWSFATLLSRYQDFFKISSLHDLGIPVARTDISQNEDIGKLDPPPPALGIMILFYLRQLPRNDRIPEIYDNYRRLVRDRHAVVAPLAMTTHTANAFLMALGRNCETLHLCPSVLEHMMNSKTSETDEVFDDRPKPNPQQIRESAPWIARPDVQTWSILLAAFLRHNQKTAAEKVLSMMRARKEQPNRVTWNTLVSGYSRLQDADAAVNSLRQMGKEGFDPDDRTLDGLGNLVDRKKLIEAFQKASQDDMTITLPESKLKNRDFSTT